MRMKLTRRTVAQVLVGLAVALASATLILPLAAGTLTTAVALGGTIGATLLALAAAILAV